MEDALVLKRNSEYCTYPVCLNPCFNGRCTRTQRRKSGNYTKFIVLILVLMEDALVLWRHF